MYDPTEDGGWEAQTVEILFYFIVIFVIVAAILYFLENFWWLAIILTVVGIVWFFKWISNIEKRVKRITSAEIVSTEGIYGDHYEHVGYSYDWRGHKTSHYGRVTSQVGRHITFLLQFEDGHSAYEKVKEDSQFYYALQRKFKFKRPA